MSKKYSKKATTNIKNSFVLPLYPMLLVADKPIFSRIRGHQPANPFSKKC